MDFKKVTIKRPSDKVVSRMRNGHSVRMMKGEGLDIMMKPQKIVAMAKKFAMGKGVQLALDPEELMANKGIEGEGIFGKKVDKLLKKTGLKKAAYTIGSAAKPFVQEGIAAATQLAAAAGVPPSVVSKISNLSQQYIDDPKSLQGKKGIRALKKAGLDIAQEGADALGKQMGIDAPDVRQTIKDVRSGSAGPALKREDYANMGADALAKALTDRAARRAAAGQGLYASGRGLYASGRGLGMGMKSAERFSSLGARGSLMGGNIQALTPQPYAENYQFRATLGNMISR